MILIGGDASARRSRASRRPAAQVPPSRIFASGSADGIEPEAIAARRRRRGRATPPSAPAIPPPAAKPRRARAMHRLRRETSARRHRRTARHCDIRRGPSARRYRSRRCRHVAAVRSANRTATATACAAASDGWSRRRSQASDVSSNRRARCRQGLSVKARSDRALSAAPTISPAPEASIDRQGRQTVEQPARPRRFIYSEHARLCRRQPAEAAQQIHTALDTNQRIVRRDLHTAFEIGDGEICKPLGVGPQRMFGIGRKRAAREHRKARQSEPLRAPDRRSRDRIAEAPRRAGTGVEKDADHGEIEFGTSPRRRIRPLPPPRGKRRPTIDAARR